MLPTIQTLTPYLTAAFAAAVFVMVAFAASCQNQNREQAIKQTARQNRRTGRRNDKD